MIRKERNIEQTVGKKKEKNVKLFQEGFDVGVVYVFTLLQDLHLHTLFTILYFLNFLYMKATIQRCVTIYVHIQYMFPHPNNQNSTHVKVIIHLE